MRPWSQRLFGAATCGTSALNPFVDWWTSSLRDCPASPTHAPGSAKEIQTPEVLATATGQFQTSCASFPSVAPPWCSSKTCQLGFAELSNTFDLSATNYREWVTSSLSRSLSLRQMLARAMSAKEFSSWPTCRANDGNGGDYQNQSDGSTQPTLTGAANRWPSARATDGTNGGPNARDSSGSPHLSNLAAKWNHWDTPDANPEMPNSGSNRTGQPAGLGNQAMMWPTPRSSESENRTTKPAPTHGTTHGTTLAGEAATWGTPTARDHKDGACNLETNEVNGLLARQDLSRQFSPLVQVTSIHGQELSPTEVSTTERRRLNPAFVNWLQGNPWWWTRSEPINCAAQEIKLWRYRQRLRLWSFFAGQI